MWSCHFPGIGQIPRVKYTGTIKGGMVVFDGSSPLKEGTVVLVEEAREQEAPGRRLKELVGAVKNLPSDMARNHDHYVHGRPKK
jgi:hypothetical protein